MRYRWIARGDKGVRSVSVARRGGRDSLATLQCDCIAMAGGWQPAVHLFTQARGRLSYDSMLGAVRAGQDSSPYARGGNGGGRPDPGQRTGAGLGRRPRGRRQPNPSFRRKHVLACCKRGPEPGVVIPAHAGIQRR